MNKRFKYPLETEEAINIIQSHYLSHLNGCNHFPLKCVENYTLSCFLISLAYAVRL